jgi:hypothetical protein
MALTDLITRNYSNFQGVDFSNDSVSLTRSPNALNMWKNYKDEDGIQTRPGMKLQDNFGNNILGLFFFEKGGTQHVLVHSGTKLLKWNNYPSTPAQTSELWVGMNVVESSHFIFEDTLFILDGLNYLEYNGTEVKKVVGTIPTTSYIRNPDGSTSIDEDTDTDLVYQGVNFLTPLRKNVFKADGTSTKFYLDAKELDPASTYLMKADVGGILKIENIDFDVDRDKGIVTFHTAPEKDAKVYITLSKTDSRYTTMIPYCKMLAEFDNRVFFSGNVDYPDVVFHSELRDPRYIRDEAYYQCGIDKAPITGLVPGNGVMWVLKDIAQNEASLYYMTPQVSSLYVKEYVVNTGSIALGCISRAINFSDDIVFFSKNGLEGVSSSSMYSEQILGHRSTLVDGKLLKEELKNIKFAEYEGYLMCLIDSHIYLADRRARVQSSSGDIEYEWYYWELPNSISFIREYRGELFLGNKEGNLYKLEGIDDNGTDITSYWTTAKDNFGYLGYTKTTNKRGNTVYFNKKDNNEIKVSTITDGVEKEKMVVTDEKGYAPFRIKDKKFTQIQLKFSSNKPFGMVSCTLQGFVAGYIKR